MTTTPIPDSRPDVAACYIVRNGRVLMIQRRKREGALEWTGVSGNVEPGETAEQAALREAREELGLDVVIERRLGDRIYPYTGRHLIYFACRIVSGEPSIAAADEVAAFEWCDLPTVLKHWANLGPGGIYPPVREYLETNPRRGEPMTAQLAVTAPTRLD